MSNAFIFIFKALAAVATTVFLGALGSGFWEHFLGDWLDWLARQTVRAFAWGLTSYRDSIYETAAQGFHESHALALYTNFLAIIPFAYLLVLRRHPTAHRPQAPRSTTRDFIRSRKGYWLIVVLTMSVLVTVLFTTLRLRHINETITYSLGTFEILRPYMSERQYASYRSRYFSMHSAAEFDALHAEILALARSKHVRLPNYVPL